MPRLGKSSRTANAAWKRTMQRLPILQVTKGLTFYKLTTRMGLLCLLRTWYELLSSLFLFLQTFRSFFLPPQQYKVAGCHWPVKGHCSLLLLTLRDGFGVSNAQMGGFGADRVWTATTGIWPVIPSEKVRLVVTFFLHETLRRKLKECCRRSLGGGGQHRSRLKTNK